MSHSTQHSAPPRKSPLVGRILRGLLAGVLYALFMVVALLISVHFVVNSSAGSRLIGLGISAAIPGKLEVRRVVIGPSLGAVQLFGVAIRTPGDKTPAVEVDSVTCQVALGALLRSLLLQKHALHLRIERIRIHKPKIRLAFGADGKLKLLEAFDDGKPAKKGPPTKLTLKLEPIRVHGGSLQVNVPGLRTLHRIHRINASVNILDGKLSILAPALRLEENRITLQNQAAEPGKLRDITFGALELKSFSMLDSKLAVKKLRVALLRSSIVAGGELDLGGDQKLNAQTRIQLGFDEPLLKRLVPELSGKLTLDLNLYGSLNRLVTGIRLRSELLKYKRLPIANLLTLARVTLDRRGKSAQIEGVLDRLNLDIADGNVTIDSGVYNSRWLVKPKQPKRSKKKTARNKKKPLPKLALELANGFQARIKLSSLNLVKLLAQITDKPATGGKNPLAGKLSGTIKLAHDRLFHTIGVELKLKLSSSNQRPAPLKRAIQLSGRAAVVMKPLEPTPTDGFDPSQLEVQLSLLRIAMGSDRISLRGRVSPLAGTLDLRLGVQLPKIQGVLSELGVNLAGSLKIFGSRIRGSFTNPHVTLNISADQLALPILKLGNLTAKVGLRNGMLNLQSLTLKPPWARSISLTAKTRLFRGSVESMRRRFDVRVSRLDISGLKPGPLLMDKKIGGQIDLALRNIRLQPHALFKYLNVGSGKLTATALRYDRDKIENLKASFRIAGSRMTLTNLTLAVDKRGHQLKGSGWFDLLRQSLAVELETNRLKLERLDALVRRKVPIKGSVKLKLGIRGSLKGLRTKGRIELKGLSSGKTSLGDATINILDRGPGKIGIVSKPFFRGLELTPRTQLTLKGTSLKRLFLELDSPVARPLDLKKLIPALKGRVKSATFGGRVEVTVDFRKRTRLSAKVSIPRNGIRVVTEGLELKNVNPTPAIVVFNDHDIAVAGLALESIVTLTGGQDAPKTPPRLTVYGLMKRRTGKINARIKGTIDLGVLRLLSSVAESSGLLTVDMKLKGTVNNPIPSGRIVTGAISVTPRGGQEIQLDKDGRILFKPGATPGLISVRIDKDHPLKAHLGDGLVRLTGGVDLSKRGLHRLKVKVSGAGLVHRDGSTLTLSLSPELTLTGKQLQNPGKRDIRVVGRVEITEGLFKKISTGLGGGPRQDGKISTPLEQSMPWITGVKLKVKVRGLQNFKVMVQKGNFGKAEMEVSTNLDVKGTIGNPRITGRVKIDEGKLSLGVIKKEFELDRGTIDFTGNVGTPTVNVVASTSITYEETIGKGDGDDLEEREVTVIVRVTVTGTLPDKLKVTFSSTPRMDQRSLMSLLIFGKPIDNEKGGALGMMALNQLANSLPSAFAGIIGDVDVQVLRKLGYAISWARSIGNIKLKTKFTDTGKESKFSAGFKIQLGDRWYFTGKVKVNQTKQRKDYDSQIKYRLPLD